MGIYRCLLLAHYVARTRAHLTEIAYAINLRHGGLHHPHDTTDAGATFG